MPASERCPVYLLEPARRICCLLRLGLHNEFSERCDFPFDVAGPDTGFPKSLSRPPSGVFFDLSVGVPAMLILLPIWTFAPSSSGWFCSSLSRREVRSYPPPSPAPTQAMQPLNRKEKTGRRVSKKSRLKPQPLCPLLNVET